MGLDIPVVPYKWPLAVHLLWCQWWILFSDHTFESLTPYVDLARTCRFHVLGYTGYLTTDPENVKAVLATKFEDYGLGSRRSAYFPLLGEPHGNMDRGGRGAVRDSFDYAALGCHVRARLVNVPWLYSPAKLDRACKAVRDWGTFFVAKALE